MGETITVILKLKEPVKNIEDEPLKNFEKVKDKYKDDGRGNKIPKTMEELNKEAPDLMRGELLSGILINTVKPDNKEQSSQILRLAKKIRFITLKAKGEWEVDEDTITLLMKFLDKVPLDASSNQTVGEIQVMLEDAMKELYIKKQPKV